MSERVIVCGIVNATPDSFSDGGRYDPLEQAAKLLDEGADWLDVGGESTRPGATPVDLDEEWRRVSAVVNAFGGRTRVSIDTTKPEVARRALGEGATIINDITGLASPEMAALTAGAWGTVVMHSRGTPQTMTRATEYGDLVAEVRAFLVERAARAQSAHVWIDPGIGFAKTSEQSLDLLAGLGDLVATGLPVLVGASRKSFIGQTLGIKNPAERLFGSLAAAASAYHAGAEVLRVHDVKATRQLLDMLRTIDARRNP